MTISEKVMKTAEFNDMVLYRVACTCGLEDHDVSMCIEHDRELNCIYLTLYDRTEWIANINDDLNFFQRFWERIKVALRVLFTGYIELESTLVMDSEEQIRGFVTALLEGLEHVKKYQAKHDLKVKK